MSWDSVPLHYIEDAITRSIPYFQGAVKVTPFNDLDSEADRIISDGLDEFTWSLHFDPAFLCRLLYSGFLPIAANIGPPEDPLYVLQPKLHHTRCVVDPRRVRVQSRMSKRAGGYTLSLNQAWDAVIAGVSGQHSHNWLYPPLAGSLRAVNSSSTRPSVTVHSVEVWDTTRRLVAGEIGYAVGAVYTSMTGFYDHTVTGAGRIQLTALAGLLTRCGFELWDLGMVMDYKRDLGAVGMPREEFVPLLRRLRTNRDTRLVLTDPGNCADVIHDLVDK
jgi:Leu/Phe-tRNA-protein transferase